MFFLKTKNLRSTLKTLERDINTQRDQRLETVKKAKQERVLRKAGKNSERLLIIDWRVLQSASAKINSIKISHRSPDAAHDNIFVGRH